MKVREMKLITKILPKILACGTIATCYGQAKIESGQTVKEVLCPFNLQISSKPVILFCHRKNAKDADELKQRKITAFKTVTYGGYRETPRIFGFGGPDYKRFSEDLRYHPEIHEKSASYIRANLYEALKHAKVLCVDATAWKAMSKQDKDLIKRKVKTGMALMMPKPGKQEFADFKEITGKNRWRKALSLHKNLKLKGLAKVSILRAKYGQGNVSVINVPSALNYKFLTAQRGTYFDFQNTLMLSLVEMAYLAGDPSMSKNAVTDVYFINADGKKVSEPLPCGRYIDYRQLGNKSFAAADKEVTDKSELCLKPVKQLFGPDEDISATYIFKGEGGSLSAAIVDFWGRTVAKKELGVPRNQGEFKLSAPLPRSRYQELRLTLARNGKTIRTVSSPVYRKINGKLDEFQLFLWSGSYSDYRNRKFFARHASLGQNCAFSPGSGEQYLISAIRNNFNLFSITHTGARTLDKLCDPEFIEKNKKKLLNYADQYHKYGGAYAMSHGDELYVRGWKKECRDWTKEPVKSALIAYLKKRYGNDIKELNKAWHGSFADFETAAMTKGLDIPKSPRAPYLDYCMFIEYVFCGYFEKLNTALKKKYPTARIGIDGIEKFSPFDGVNWPRLQKINDVMIIYPHIDHDNKLFSWRSAIDFKRPGTFGGFWLAYDSDFIPEVAGIYPWMALYSGLSSIGYFQSYEVSDRYAALKPDWQPRPSYAAVAKSVRTIRKKALDKMLLNAKREYSPIAIHYSPRSLNLSFSPEQGTDTHINQLGTRNTYKIDNPKYIGHTANAGSAFMLLFSDMGYNPEFVNTKAIENGALDKYKILILPLSICLTDKEVKAIEKFVADGGFLITDYAPGIRGGNGNLLKVPALNNIFGVSGTGQQPVMTSLSIVGNMRCPNQGFAMLSLSLMNVLVPPVSITDEAKALGGAGTGMPVFITNFYKKGRTLYLNFSIESYMGRRSNANSMSIRTTFADVAQELGQVPLPAKILKRKPGFFRDRAYFRYPAMGAQIKLFKDGDINYTAFYWDYKRDNWEKEDLLVLLPYPSHLYDVIESRYLGFSAKDSITVEGCPVKLYALMPYKIESVSINAPNRAEAGKPVKVDLSVSADTDRMQAHTLSVLVTDEKGRPIPALTTKLRALNGKCSFSFVPSFDAKKLTLHAREAVSGITATRNIEVK